ncbi:uncharacterized protein KY384_005277 [Bacidia gigantensis]|uniref:uncharacterized protein n=1 Tax=Bacidia gigantensis TaxID=2732470 RepID=UPI001D0422DD|nr:uncharacterized protein KY384_005277 [Bacidia gigantensis]KAG8529796.1 hypothetical protein KY384_005277 [Bacidia gigantensis]
MAFVDLGAINFYEKPPSKSGPCGDKRPPAHNGNVPTVNEQCESRQALTSAKKPGAYTLWSSDNSIPVSLRVENDSGVEGWRGDSTPVFKMPPGWGTGPLRGSSSNSTEADKQDTSTPGERAVRGDDRSRFHHPPGPPCKSRILGKPIAGKTACDLIEVDSGDDSSSSDDSGSNIGHETSSATTPTCAVSPSVSSLDKDKIKKTVTGGRGAEGPVTVALNLQEHQDSSWLDVDQFPDTDLRFEDRAAEDKCQKLGDLEDNLRSDSAKDGQAEDGSREMDHHANRAEDEDGVEHGREDAITDPEMDGIEVYSDGSQSKGGHRAGVSGDVEGPVRRPSPSSSSALLTSPMAGRGRGRPCRSRTAITVGNAVWEVTKIAGDE